MGRGFPHRVDVALPAARLADGKVLVRPHLGGVGLDADAAGAGGALFRGADAHREDFPGFQPAGKERLVFLFVIQQHLHVAGFHIGDARFPVQVLQFGVVLLHEEDAVGIGLQEVAARFQADAGVEEGAGELDGDAAPGGNHHHLGVSVLGTVEGGGGEADGNHAHGIIALRHFHHFGGVPVGALVQDFSVSILHGEDEVVGVRNGFRGFGENTPVQGPAQFPGPASYGRPEVVTGTQRRHQGQQCGGQFKQFHKCVVLGAGHRCPAAG